MSTLTIHDETTSGQKTNTLTLAAISEKLTVRELIRARIYQEVQDYNQNQTECFHGLVAPTESEPVGHGSYKVRHHRKIDWEQQYRCALEAFQKGGFLVLVDDQTAQSLDQQFDIKVTTEVSFVKMTPLVSG